MGKLSVSKLMVSSAPLTLEVEGVSQKLELKLCWNMRAVALIETSLRSRGRLVNVLQRPAQFWAEMDCTTLAIAVWAAAQQAQPEYSGEEGFGVIESYLVPDNYDVALGALKEAFLESLSKERRDAIKKAESGEKETVDPTKAPATT